MKKILFSLLLFIGFLISFCSSEYVKDLINYEYSGSVSVDGSRYSNLITIDNSKYKTYCILFSGTNPSGTLKVGFANSSNGTPSNLYNFYSDQFGNTICIYGNKNYLNVSCTSCNPYTLGFYIYGLPDLLNTTLPQYSSFQCQTEYGLIPVSSVDQFYCESNNLCSVCTPATGEDLIFSNVYINNILHPGRPSIFVNIPDYIFWDYSVNDNDFNIYVGSGYDVDYIDSIVSINSYRPTSEDFTDVFVGGFTLIMPYVIIILFIVFVRKFIKRIFK